MRNKEGDQIMINESFYQQDITVLNVYAPNNRASKCMKQKLIGVNGETHKSRIIGEDLTSLLDQ